MGTDGGVTPHYGVSFVKNHIYVLSCIGGTDEGGHSSLGCVICQKSHLCITCKLTFVWFQLNVLPVTLVTCSDNTTGDDYIFKQLSPC